MKNFIAILLLLISSLAQGQGTLIKVNGWQFGDPDETISSVLGKNKRLGLLKPLGRALDRLLDKIDKGHSINSIEE